MDKLYCQLGRHGDILGILPLCYMDAQKGEKVGLMVAEEFSGLLEGVSYVEPVVFKGHMADLVRATKEAEAICKKVIVTQLVGPYEAIQKIITRNGKEYLVSTDSFQKDQWHIADRLVDWLNQPNLVIDRRNLERESRLVSRFVTNKKKLILVSCNGLSSPFPWKNLLLTLLRTKFTRGYEILDLAGVRGERFFDLLGLYEKAHCLVTIDTAHLHLANACPDLPVVALINDKPQLWNGSAWRPSHICNVRYGDFDHRASDILDAIAGIGWGGCWFSNARPSAKFHHVWSQYEGAWRGSFKADAWVETPIEVGMVGRDSQNMLKDTKRFPFVKDVLRVGLMRAKDEDHILLTRSDTVIETMPEFNGTPGFAHRMQDGYWHPACDLFVFTKKWWKEHRSDYPNLVMGRDWAWHRCLKELMLKHGGKELPFTVTRNADKTGLVDNKDAPPYLTHNYETAEKWMEEKGITFTYPPVEQQVKTLPLQIGALKPFGYNPGMVRQDGRLLIVYRHHFDNTSSTRLRIAELSDQYEVLNDRALTIPNSSVSVEDAKFFTRRGELWLSWVDSKWTGKTALTDAKSVVKFGRLVEGDEWTVQSVVQPVFGKNDFSVMEKNWVSFGHGNDIFFIYQSHLKQIVIQFDDSHTSPSLVHESEGRTWEYGPIKGGSNPVPYEGKLLRFFHSTLDNEPPPWHRRYYVGALLMEPEPPFRQIALSKKPVIRGSEFCELSDLAKSQCYHFKGNVVFPGGCVPEWDGFLLSLGVNDNRCAIVNLTKDDLHL